MLTTLEEKISPEHAAVIVVDVQNDFCHEDSPFTRYRSNLDGVQATVRQLDRFLGAARDAGVPVIFIRNITRPGSQTEVQQEQTMRSSGAAPGGPTICRDGTWGADFYVVAPQPGELIIEKTRYSAFINTELPAVLAERGITSLLMTGVSTNCCVESTARDGYMLDYYITAVSDCCGAYKEQLHDAMIENVCDRFGIVATSHEIAAAWASLRVAAPA